MRFDLHIGIDYSGAETSSSRLPGLQIYSDEATGNLKRVPTDDRYLHWSREKIAEWIVSKHSEGRTFIAGIDHAFSFPESYLNRYHLADWDHFLPDFRDHWPTHRADITVKSLRGGNERTGCPTELRLTEKWTSSAKSVFLFDVPGSVATSTHAGIPWLTHLRKELKAKVHFWPFDDWTVPEAKSVIIEVYPSIFRRRYKYDDGLSPHERDAYAIARWLKDTDERAALNNYFHPPLTEGDKRLAKREGWIFGIC